jgi:hypothetical protein
MTTQPNTAFSPVSLFVKDLGERAGKTAIQAILLCLTPYIVSGQLDVLTVDWVHVLDFGLGGAILSVLTSLGSQPIGNPYSASLVKPPVIGA